MDFVSGPEAVAEGVELLDVVEVKARLGLNELPKAVFKTRVFARHEGTVGQGNPGAAIDDEYARRPLRDGHDDAQKVYKNVSLFHRKRLKYMLGVSIIPIYTPIEH